MLRVTDLHFKYIESGIDTLKNITFELPQGAKLAIVGESGSGKTTLLKLLAGLLDPIDGEIRLDNRRILGPAYNLVPGSEYIRMVMQDYGLRKNQSIYENIVFHLRFLPEDKQVAMAHEISKAFSIENLLDKPPHLLSGGQQQRAAIACCIAANPQVMLMDEPFSNLDVLLTDQIKWYLTKHIEKNKNSFVFVTHHTGDALAMADYALAMRNGKIEQFGTTYELFEQPISPYIAALFSDCSFFKFNKLETMGVKGLAKIEAELGNSFLVGIRTTSIEVARKGKSTCKGRVIRTEYEGARLKLFIRLENNVQLKAYSNDLSFEKGDYVKLNFTKNDLMYFPNHKSL